MYSFVPLRGQTSGERARSKLFCFYIKAENG